MVAILLQSQCNDKFPTSLFPDGEKVARGAPDEGVDESGMTASVVDEKSAEIPAKPRNKLIGVEVFPEAAIYPSSSAGSLAFHRNKLAAVLVKLHQRPGTKAKAVTQRFRNYDSSLRRNSRFQAAHEPIVPRSSGSRHSPRFEPRSAKRSPNHQGTRAPRGRRQNELFFSELGVLVPLSLMGIVVPSLLEESLISAYRAFEPHRSRG